MTTATKITLVRIVLIPVFMVCLYCSVYRYGLTYAALAIFIVASLSDYVDGQIARKYNQVSDLGKFLDPLADKLLVISAMCIFCQWEMFPAWALMIVLAREFAVTGLRLIAVGDGRVIAAAWSGKVKTACTMVGICLMLAFGRGYSFSDALNCVVMALIVLTTLYSGIEYFIKNADVLRAERKN